ncbi:MAG TPA: sigma-70 family RNA polymerase sigma factor [Kofleriaceae bacterium]|nr:sigma-70 family RNA polymerase sigma factor [Kofleriaceae bacterium]
MRELGPEILGFLSGVLGNDDADEVFSTLSERLWRSLTGFEGRCSLRTWTYVLARHELGRFRRGIRRHEDGRVPISELQEVLAAVKTQNRSTLARDRRDTLERLRDELPIEDRTLLILRVDRNLSWDEIALAFAEDPETFGDHDRRRESARLRKRFQLVKQRLMARARAAFAS